MKTRRDILCHGGILFDVDETILDVHIDPYAKRHAQSLLDAPVCDILVELLQAGFRLAAVTGNDLDRFHERFSRIVFERLKEIGAPELIERFEAYGNGAACHVLFRCVGDELETRTDWAYTGPNMLEDFEQLAACLTEYLDRNPNLVPAPEELAKEYDPGLWKYSFAPGEGWFELSGSGKKTPVPSVVVRSHEGRPAMITVKPLPSRRHMRQDRPGATDIRRQACSQIRRELQRALGPRLQAYYVTEAGWSSIDVTKRVSKAHAVHSYLRNHNLRASDILYFGNEFRVGGNDLPVLKGVDGVHVVSVNQPRSEVFCQSNVFYGGARGTASAAHHFGDILERLQDGLAAATEGRAPADPPTPVLREKILALYQQEREEQEQLFLKLLTRSSEEFLAINSETSERNNVALALAEQREHLTLVIPAAGASCRLGADLPAPLYPIAGKPAILYPLDAFARYASRVVVVVNPAHAAQFDAILRYRRDCSVAFAVQGEPLGSGAAVLRALELVDDPQGHVVIVWSNLILSRQDVIRRTLAMHLTSRAALTFPTMFEPDPALRVQRDADGQVVGVAFAADPDATGFWERDCAFFCARIDPLRAALSAMDSTGLEHGESAPDAATPPQAGPRDLEFLRVVRQLREMGHVVLARPCAVAGEFVSFNTPAEAAHVSDIITEGRIS